VGVHGDVHRLELAAVEDRGYATGLAELAGHAFAGAFTLLSVQYCLI
jgi:hypothetical protein